MEEDIFDLHLEEMEMDWFISNKKIIRNIYSNKLFIIYRIKYSK